MANLEIKHKSAKNFDELLNNFNTKTDGIGPIGGRTKYYNNLYTAENSPIVTYFGELIDFDELDEFTEDNAKPLIQKDAFSKLQTKGYIPENSTFNLEGIILVKARMNTNGIIRYVIAVPTATVISSWNPKIKFEKSVVKKTTTSASSASETKKTKNLTQPSSTNIGITSPSGEYHTLHIVLGEIELYTNVAHNIFKLFQQRINMYEIQFDKPFSAEELAVKIDEFSTTIRSRLPGDLSDATKLKLTFRKDFDDLVELWYETEKNNQISYTKVYDIDESPDFYLRNVPLLNSLIFNLIKIYNKYWNSFQNYNASTKLFKNEDNIQDFLTTYLTPKVFILNTTVTRDILSKLDNSKYSSKYALDKFILGDNRLLDDEFFEAYRVTRDEIKNGAFKAELQQQVSQQYEKIGDFLGEKWLSGKYTDIRSVEEFYDDLVNYIDTTELIILAAKCLLKVLPLKDLLDAICDPVLEEWDDHKEAIIQELESMDDGIAKDIAADLKELYFSTIEETAVDFIKKEATAENVMKYTGDAWDYTLGIFGYSNEQWAKKQKLIELVQNNKNSIDTKINLLVGSDKAIINQIISNETKLTNLEEQQKNLDAQLKVFGTNIPENFQRQLTYYTKKVSAAKNRRDDLLDLYNNMCDQLKIHFLLCATYDFNALRNRNVDKSKKQAINAFLDGSEKYSIPKFVPPVEINDSIVPNLIKINPYLTNAAVQHSLLKEMGAVVGDGAEGASKLNALGEIPAKLELENFENIVYNEGKGLGSEGNFVFNIVFPVTSENFDANLKNVEALMNTLSQLNSTQNDVKGSPFNSEKGLQKISNFGKDTANEALNQILGDDTNRYYLCLAIFAAIPGAAYLAYQLINDHEAIADYFKNQGKAIWKGIKRRWQVLASTDYYTMDLLSALADQLVQVGINFARDLILNGIMAILADLREQCIDEEKINAPYNPIGAIDLSTFMTASKKSTTVNQTGESIEDTESYNRIITIDPGLTGQQYETILENLSSEFTIREMAQMLDGSAPDSFYLQAIDILEEIKFLQEPEETPFYQFYVKSGIFGIKQFFAIAAKDIEPAYIEQALANYEKEKTLLLEICYGRDDSVLEQLICRDLPPAECLKALAAKAEMPKNLAKNLVDTMGSLFTEQTLPDPCAEGEGIWDESQKFGASKIGDSLFGSIEKAFEADVSKVKDIYLGTFDVFKNNPIVGGGLMKEMVVGSISKSKEERDEAAKKLEKFKPDQAIVAPMILKQFQDAMAYNPAEVVDSEGNIELVDDAFLSSDFVYFTNNEDDGDNDLYPNSVKQINLSYKAGDKTIKLFFDSSRDVVQYTNWNTELQSSVELLPVVEDPLNEGEEPETQVQSLAVQRYTALSGTNGWNIKKINPGDDNNPKFMVRPPDNLLFGWDHNTEEGDQTTPGIAFQAWNNLGLGISGAGAGTIETAKAVNDYNLKNKFYERLFSSVLKDLMATSLKQGLYNRERFIQLDLNKSIDITTDTCFFGFLNKNILNHNMQQLANRLACYNANDPAITPVNVSAIKFSLDCVIRIIVIKEVMKSLFVYGIFPQELDPKSASVYSDIIVAELKHYIPIAISNGNPTQKYETFYNEVVKKFITDMMRIIYQDDNLNDEEAFRRVIQTQFDYVKQLLHEAIFPILAVPGEDGSPEMPPISEYQIIQGTMAPGDTNVDKNLQSIGIKDQIESLQNDYFTFYMNSYQNADDKQLSAPLTKVDFVNSGVPRFNRIPRALNYMDYKTLKTVSSFDIEEILQGNNDGIVLEKFIEIDYQADFFTQNSKNLERFREFLRNLGSLPLIATAEFPTGLKVLGNMNLAETLKNMLYETKLIMFFPQLKTIIDSMGSKEENPIWHEFIYTHTYKAKGKSYTTDGLGLLFDAIFIYNYNLNTGEENPTSDFLNDLLEDSKRRKHIDWALTGKIYLSDMKELINSFSYPYWGENFQKLKKEGKPYAEENIFIEGSKSFSYSEFIINSLLPGGAANQSGLGGESVKKAYDSYRIDIKKAKDVEVWNSLGVLHFFAYLGDIGVFSPLPGILDLCSKSWIGGTENNFFIHLFKTDLSKIIKLNPCIRLSSYILSPEENSQLEPLDTLMENLENEKKHTRQKSLLKEKSGKVRITERKDEDTGKIILKEKQFVTTPLFTSRKKLPEGYYTWFTMFMLLNKDLCLDTDVYFSTIAAQPQLTDLNYSIFNLLSTTDGKNFQTADIFNFVESFEFVTPVSIREQMTKWLMSFKSTQWFNIRGLSVSKENILTHVALGEEQAKQSGQFLYGWFKDGSLSGINFSNGEAFGTKNPQKVGEGGFGADVSPYIYLTDSSLATLQENSSYFLNEDLTEVKEEFKTEIIGDGTIRVIPWQHSDVLVGVLSDDPYFEAAGLSDDEITNLVDEETWRKEINKDEGWRQITSYKFESLSKLGPQYTDPANTRLIFNSSPNGAGREMDPHNQKDWKIISPVTGEVIATCPKYIELRAKAHLPYKDNPLGQYYFIDYGFWNYYMPTDYSSSKKLQIKFAGSSFKGAKPFDAAAFQPRWLDSDGQAGGTYPPKPEYNRHMAEDEKGNWIEVGKGGPSSVINGPRGPWSYYYGASGDPMINMPKNAINYHWRPGWVEGGLTSPTKVAEPKTFDVPMKTNAYSVFQSFLSETEQEIFIDLLKSFFIQEQTTIVAVMNKLLSEKYYPEIDYAFETSLSVAFNALTTAVASANGDWQYTAGTSDNGGVSIDFGMISGMLLKMFLGAMANTVDPLWKTPWFTPGPFTPFGIAAKLLDEKGDLFTGSPDKASSYSPPGIPASCEADYSKQLELINTIIKSHGKNKKS